MSFTPKAANNRLHSSIRSSAQTRGQCVSTPDAANNSLYSSTGSERVQGACHVCAGEDHCPQTSIGWGTQSVQGHSENDKWPVIEKKKTVNAFYMLYTTHS